MECKKPANDAKCPCKSADCPRHGVCCECLSAHLARQSLPRCCFPAEPEPTGRSFEAFAKAWKV
jgi:hypothetical protein